MAPVQQFKPKKLPREHTGLLPTLPFRFVALELSVTLVDAHGWHALYVVPQVGLFEIEHGLEDQRFAYNHRSMSEAARRHTSIVAEHAGFSDLFVPVVGHDGDVGQILIAGPFRTGPMSGAEIQERWHWLTGREGHLGDPEFAAYLATALGTARFDEPRLAALERLMTCMAQSMAGSGNAEALAQQIESAETELGEATFTHRMWEVTRMLIDPRLSRLWASHYYRPRRVALGIERIPEHAVVGLAVGRHDEANPVDEAVRRHEFQRACVRLARAVGGASGPIADHGVVLLIQAERSEARMRARLTEMGERAATLARQKFGLRLHFGTSPASGSIPIPLRFQLARAAAEKALSQGVRFVHASAELGRREQSMRDLRSELARVEPRMTRLTARFAGYVDFVAAHTGYRMEPTRAHLDAGFESLAAPFVASGAIDRQTWDDVCSALDRTTETANTLSDLFSAYRRAVADVEQALAHPTGARRERSLRRAVDYIREHAVEPLSLEAAARVAGFEPHYFSRLFRQRERVTFERYVTELRIERAKQMLWRTSLSVERIGQLSGFASSPYFHRVFKRVVGETPLVFRRRPT